jgi:hypothetical protein
MFSAVAIRGLQFFLCVQASVVFGMKQWQGMHILTAAILDAARGTAVEVSLAYALSSAKTG